MQEGEELFPKNEKGEMLTADIDFIDTWKVKFFTNVFRISGMQINCTRKSR